MSIGDIATGSRLVMRKEKRKQAVGAFRLWGSGKDFVWFSADWDEQLANSRSWLRGLCQCKQRNNITENERDKCGPLIRAECDNLLKESKQNERHTARWKPTLETHTRED